MSKCPFEDIAKQRKGELFVSVSCKEFKKNIVISVPFPWPDWLVTLCAGHVWCSVMRFPSSTSPWLHRARSLCSLKSLTHTTLQQTHALVMTSLQTLCGPPLQCHNDVTDLDEIWLDSLVGRFGWAASELYHGLVKYTHKYICGCFVLEEENYANWHLPYQKWRLIFSSAFLIKQDLLMIGMPQQMSASHASFSKYACFHMQLS